MRLRRSSVALIVVVTCTAFLTTYSLNDALVKTSVCKCNYRVSRMVDELYGLTAFDSNEVPVIFDKVIVVEGGISGEFADVGKPVITWFKAVYSYDGKTSDDAEGAVVELASFVDSFKQL
jgi:hypothetical protein